MKKFNVFGLIMEKPNISRVVVWSILGLIIIAFGISILNFGFDLLSYFLFFLMISFFLLFIIRDKHTPELNKELKHDKSTSELIKEIEEDLERIEKKIIDIKNKDC